MSKSLSRSTFQNVTYFCHYVTFCHVVNTLDEALLYCIILYSNSVTLKSKLRVSGHSRSLETEPLDGSRTTYVNVKKMWKKLLFYNNV